MFNCTYFPKENYKFMAFLNLRWKLIGFVIVLICSSTQKSAHKIHGPLRSNANVQHCKAAEEIWCLQCWSHHQKMMTMNESARQFLFLKYQLFKVARNFHQKRIFVKLIFVRSIAATADTQWVINYRLDMTCVKENIISMLRYNEI